MLGIQGPEVSGRRRWRRAHRLPRGFTLIELMTVVAIIAIIAVFALPNFVKQTDRAKVSEAKETLLQLAKLVDSYAALNNRFCPTCTDAAAHTYAYSENGNGVEDTGGDSLTSWLTGSIEFNPKLAADGTAVRYDYAFSGTGASDYTITATPVAGRGAPSRTLRILYGLVPGTQARQVQYCIDVGGGMSCDLEPRKWDES
jgi:prepilin-type N-terminal cleavage/methylation domain-containing protein